MKKFKASKAGFSLVELIIVIAIMAALVAVLAPQYIKYVERSREASDNDIMVEIENALKVAAVDIDYTLAVGDNVVINHTNTTANKGSGNTTEDAKSIKGALAEYYGANYTTAKLTSKKYQSATFTVTAGTNNALNITVAKTESST